MSYYAIVFKSDESDIVTVEAEMFEIKDGFIRFFRLLDVGTLEMFSCYSADSVESCVLQNEYTQDQIIEQIENSQREDK